MSLSESTAEPRTWVKLKHPSTEDDEDTVSAFCSFIEKFLWRDYDGNKELLVVINSPEGSRRRYKYKGVTKTDFRLAWDRAQNPGEHNDNFGSWFTKNIKDTYEYERFE